MTTHDILIFGLFGAAFWIVGTIWYEFRGPPVFETSSLRFWINFVITPIVSAVVCVVLLKWCEVPAAEWSSAALLIALPGMFGEAVLLSGFSHIHAPDAPRDGREIRSLPVRQLRLVFYDCRDCYGSSHWIP